MRALRDIALEVANDWPTMNSGGASNALACMRTMGDVTEPFGADPNGYRVIGSFLMHSIGWRGPIARRVKSELREMAGHPRSR